MEHVRRIYLRSWRSLAIGISLAGIAYLLYFHRLGSLLPGYSKPELGTFSASSNWHDIASNPVNAPYKAFVWLLTALLHHSVLATRAVAACFGLLAGLLFFMTVRAWCSYRAAFLATVMFVTSAGLLHFARLGTGYILQMGVLALLAFASWYRSELKHRTIIGYLLVIFFVMLWYVPGMVWFELLAILPLIATIKGQLHRTKRLHLAGLGAVLLLCLAPLVIASIHHPRIFLQVVGLPQTFHALAHVGSNLINVILAITIRSNGNPLLWVGHAPLLSAVEVILCLFGALSMFREGSRRRTFLFGSAAVGLALTALGGSVVFACLVPILYLFVAIGIDQLLSQWLAVFPRNPVARATGISLVCIMLAFSVFYQLRTYYVAWPHAPATRQAFSYQAP